MFKPKSIYSSFIFATFLLLMGILLVPNQTVQAAGTVSISQIDAKSTSVKCSWDKVANAATYKVHYMSADKYTPDVSSTSSDWKRATNYLENAGPDDTSVSLTGLTKASSYYVRVRALNSSNNIIAESILHIVTSPDNVTQVRQTAASSDSITLSWDAVNGADGYNIYAGNGSDNSKPVATVTTNSATITGLTESQCGGSSGQKYSVKAFKKSDAFTAEAFSAATSSFVYVAPAKIKNLKLISWPSTTNKATVQWNMSGYCTGYELQVLNTSNKVLKTYNYSQWGIKQQIFNISSIKNAACRVQIRGYKNANNTTYYGDWTSIVCVPSAKITKAKALGNGRVSLKWNKVTGATGYTIYAVMDVGNNRVVKKKVAVVKKSKTAYTVKNLKKYKNSYRYNTYFMVQANKVKINGKNYSSKYDYKQYKTFKKVKLK